MSFDHQQPAWGDSTLVCRTIEAKAKLSAVGIGFTREEIDNARAVLLAALATAGTDNRKVARLITAFATLYRMDQTDRLAATYDIPAEGREGEGRVLSPCEVAEMMDQSVPALEYKGDNTVITSEKLPDDSCSRPATPDPARTGFGDGVWITLPCSRAEESIPDVSP